MLGVSSLPSQPGGLPQRGGQQPLPPLPLWGVPCLGCAWTTLHHLSALLQSHKNTCDGLLPPAPVPYNWALFSPGEERPSRKDMVLLPAALLETRALFCCPCRSLKPQLHSRPEIEGTPSLVSVLLPGPKGHASTRDAQPAVRVTAPGKGLRRNFN